MRGGEHFGDFNGSGGSPDSEGCSVNEEGVEAAWRKGGVGGVFRPSNERKLDFDLTLSLSCFTGESQPGSHA